MLCCYKIVNKNFIDLDRDKKSDKVTLTLAKLYFFQCDNSRQHSRSCFSLLQHFGVIEFCWHACKLYNQLHFFKTSNFGPRLSCIMFQNISCLKL